MTTSGRKRGRPPRRVVFELFASAMAELGAHGGLPELEQAEPLWNDLWHMDVHHSTAIEGNTLVLREVEALLDQGRVVGAKELKDYMEVLGYGEAATWVYQQAGDTRAWEHDQILTMTEVREVHRITMGHVWAVSPHVLATSAETPGSFRQHDIREFPGGMRPPTFPLVPAMLDAWLAQVNEVGSKLHVGEIPADQAPVSIADLHCSFERIHPFLDGNGRTGRLLLNLILVRLGWPPVIILKTQRRRYLAALVRADAQDAEPLAEIIARGAIASMNALLPTVSKDGDWLPLSALVSNQMSLAALRQAAIRGRLQATLDTKGQWRSTRQAVNTYLETKYRRH